MKNEKLIASIPFLLILVNALLKGLYLTATSIGGDKPFSIYHALMDPGQSLEYSRTETTLRYTNSFFTIGLMCLEQVSFGYECPPYYLAH